MAKTTRSAPQRTKRTASKGVSGTSSRKASASKSASPPPEENPSNEFDELEALNRLEAEAEAAAQAAAAAKAAYLARRTGAQAGAQNAPQSEPEPAQPAPSPPFRSGDDYLDMLSRMFDDAGTSGWDPDKFDDMTRGVGMVLGSGPAFATLGSMLANSNAQGSVLMNATQMQRQLDQVGLCCTSACVKQLLSINQNTETD